MISLQDIKDFCQLNYLDSGIPVYIYRNNTLLQAFPEQSACTYPPKHYIEEFAEMTDDIAHLSTPYGAYFVAVKPKDQTELCVVLGPANYIPFTDADFHTMYADYVVVQEDRKDFKHFFQLIPPIALSGLLAKAAVFNYFLNHEMRTHFDLLDSERTIVPYEHTEKQTEDFYQQKEDFQHNNSFEIESMILHFVESGDVDGLKNMTLQSSVIHSGTIAPNQLRQTKNIHIIITALATRRAISSGVDADEAFQMSDLYIQTAENLNDPSAVQNLNLQMLLAFAQKVKDKLIPKTSDEALQRAIQYVLQNINCPITAAEVADHVGFSRSYFSTYFKEQLGFTLSAFILRCKLEEGKHLLQFTDKPLSVISNYLCFSSQSHFQTAFKKQYNVTPLQFRKQPELYGRGLLENER
ncbi:AraC family transcriptional regulator [Mediterraneibacter glycyrrhizinilyticus]|uniref:helix-turn-helix domain-containing protein n=1 Tax=Mediterraneibacter glycyrrhizinilyticus TaxID=342942 RepID=UPI001D089B11|nr:helix-turn-helix domain-containing protein [Mediterraneibacter glycyrrhizinilyticus]MCB6309104.1 AraC family transcriptional regulator [Lachnospiraceae bacterium 210521-DFI.1.109]MCB6426450.1 AraC family transcriptional regulator [Mediterraneibacter glycyrrhizinilyticus]